MTLKRFFSPFLLTLIFLFGAWTTGADSILKSEDSTKDNLQKYIYVQKLITDNYVRNLSLDELYKQSIRGLLKNQSDTALIVTGSPLDTTRFQTIKINNLRESFQHFEQAYLYMANKNPEENMDKRTEDAIREMMSIMDPHSIYIEKKTNERIQEEFDGKFQGIGVQFDIVNDTITVITPLSGGPSEQVGIMSGDKIVTIDDTLAVGFTNEDVVRHLRGPKGTHVDVGIKRGNDKSLTYYTIIRDDIPLYTVDAAYMLDDITGYIKINRFARTTHEEFITAMKELKSIGMERLVLDLRNNPGGFMDQALTIADEFIPSSMKLLSTKGRKTRFNQDYYASGKNTFVDKPLIVLVNEGSASASEIVSGTLQDHDLALIVGRRSFGKGLVQQQYELPDGSSIRVTISKYYTPSGRLIQKPYISGIENYAYELVHRDEDATTDAIKFINNLPDSLIFSTDSGRPVYGGGGIVPDHIIQNDTTSSAVLGLMRRNRLDVQFVVDFMNSNGDEEHNKRITWLNKTDFETFRKTFKINNAESQKFKALLEENKYIETDTVDAAKMHNGVLYAPIGTYKKDEWIIKGFLKAYIARHIWGASYFYPVYNDEFDTILKTAENLWYEVEALKEYRKKHTTVINR